MSIASRKASVTLLHKGEGPSLLPGGSQQLNITEQPSYAHNFPPKPFHSPTSIAKNKKKREIGKCIDRQEANTMFAKRIQDRTARHFRPSSSTNLRPPLPKTSPLQQQQCELYLRERLFANGPARFPPPSFMPRWNPRRKDNTYASKMVLEDPWSLPADERLALTKRTGLRLKTLTKMYQYKVGANLPLGKAADPSKCQCYVNFCDHCNQKHTGRCLLHTQLLRDIEPDCKDIDFETCPLAKNVEDLPLHKITDPRIYIGELVRRLRAGELSEIPPFPAKILKAVIKYWSPELFATSSVDEDFDHHARKVVTTDATAQTELVVIDQDMQTSFKSSSVQTSPPDKDQPFLASKLTKTTEPRGYYSPVCTTTTVDVQADPCDLVKFKDISKRAVPTLARHICDQALQEISDEVRIRHIQTIRHGYMQQLLDMQRTEEFKRSAEKWKCSAKMEEQTRVELEYKMEMEAEDLLGVVSFAQSYLHNFPGLAMDKLKTQGHIINSDLLEIQTVYKEELNKGATKTTENSRNILDEIIQNAIYNGGTEAYMQVVDEIFLNPKLWFTKPLHDVLPVEAGNFTPIEALIMRLRALGLHFTTNGRLSADLLEHDDEGVEDGWENLLDDVRVKFDKSGHPNELVDSWGDVIPIQVRWNKVKDSETGQSSDPKEHRPSRYVFRIPQVIHWDASPKKYGSQSDESDSNEELDLNADDDEVKTILQKRSMFRSFHDYHEEYKEPEGSV